MKTETEGGTHFCNRIGGVRLDFTAAQFEAPIGYDDSPADPEEALADTSPEQLAALIRAPEEDQ